MKRMSIRTPIVLGLVMLLVHLPLLGANTPLGKVIPRSGSIALNGMELKVETTFFSGDTVATQADSGAVVLLLQGELVFLGPDSRATVNGEGEDIVVVLESGMTRIHSGNAHAVYAGNGHAVYTNARGLVIRPSQKAVYQVAIEGSVVLVGSQQGSVEVVGANQSVVVPAGKAIKFEVAMTNPLPGPTGVGAHNLAPSAIILIALAAAGAAVVGGFAIANSTGGKAAVSPSEP